MYFDPLSGCYNCGLYTGGLFTLLQITNTAFLFIRMRGNIRSYPS